LSFSVPISATGVIASVPNHAGLDQRESQWPLSDRRWKRDSTSRPIRHAIQSTAGHRRILPPIALISHGRGRGPSSRRGTCRRSTSLGAPAEGPHNSCSGRRGQHIGSSKNTLAAGIQFAAIGRTPGPPSGKHRSTANIVMLVTVVTRQGGHIVNCESWLPPAAGA
jgi:hypothetical protein